MYAAHQLPVKQESAVAGSTSTTHLKRRLPCIIALRTGNKTEDGSDKKYTRSDTVDSLILCGSGFTVRSRLLVM